MLFRSALALPVRYGRRTRETLYARSMKKGKMGGGRRGSHRISLAKLLSYEEVTPVERLRRNDPLLSTRLSLFCVPNKDVDIFGESEG